MIGDRDRVPAVDLVETQLAPEIGTARLALEPLAQYRQAGVGARHARKAHARLRRVVQAVGQGAGGAGEHALQAVAGEITGLCPGLDVRYSDPIAVSQVGELDRLDRTDLHALAALDTRRKEIAFTELCIFQRAGRTQAMCATAGDRHEAGQCGNQRSADQHAGANELAPVLFSSHRAERWLLGFVGTHVYAPSKRLCITASVAPQ